MSLLFRHAFRSLLKSPGFTLVAVLTLSLGIGATTTLYSVVSTLVLNPTRLPDPSTLVQLWVRNPERNFNAPAMSWPRFEEIRREQTVFSEVAVSAFGTLNFIHEGEPEQLTGLYATSGFLRVLGVTPVQGRNFVVEEDLAGSAPVVILSHEIWQTRFGGRSHLVGQPILLSGTSYTIVGILPPLLGNPYGNVQLITPRPNEFAGLTPQQVANGAGYLQTIARLKPGVSLEAAEAEIATLTHRYTTSFAERLDGRNETTVVPFIEALVGNVRPTLNLLTGVVALVLLIACANVSNLFLGRLSARQREIGVRLSLGATRRQLIHQFLLESLLFSGVSALLGIIVASVTLDTVQRLSANLTAPGTTFEVDAPALGFTVLVGVTCAVLVGLIPAWQASRSNLAEVLKDASARSQSGGVRGGKFRAMLVVVEVALSVVLLIGSGLLLVSFFRLQSTPPGFDPNGVASALVSIPAERYRTPEQQSDFFRQVIDRLREHPQVSSAAAAIGLPLSGFIPQSPLQHPRSRHPSAAATSPGRVAHRDRRLLQDPGHTAPRGAAVLLPRTVQAHPGSASSTNRSPADCFPDKRRSDRSSYGAVMPRFRARSWASSATSRRSGSPRLRRMRSTGPPRSWAGVRWLSWRARRGIPLRCSRCCGRPWHRSTPGNRSPFSPPSMAPCSSRSVSSVSPPTLPELSLSLPCSLRPSGSTACSPSP
jgi:predicted permease